MNKNQIRTVVELDMIGYGNVAKELEEHLGVEVVEMLNNQIQSFVDVGLNAVGKNRDEVVKASNGDNAVIVFECADDAHKFAQAIYQETWEYNTKKDVRSAQRWFRIGAATGKLYQKFKNGKEIIAGSVITRAYRLEAAGKSGDFLIDINTYNLLSEELKKKYGLEETVRGKLSETFQVRRCKMIPDSSQTIEKQPKAEDDFKSDFERYLSSLEEGLKKELRILYKNNTQVFKIIIADGGFPTEFLQDGQSIYVTINEFLSKCKGMSKNQLSNIFSILYEENKGSKILEKAVNFLN